MTNIKYIIISLLLGMAVSQATGLEALIPTLDTIIADVYGVDSAFEISSQEKEHMKQSGNAPTYGELTPNGMIIVVNYMMERLKAYFGEALPEKIIFIDVGSGAGKVPFGACIEGPFYKCIGVEYSKERHEVAAKAHVKMVSEWSSPSALPPGREVVFINDDALNINMRKIYAIYVSSLCFEKPFMKKLLDKFEAELPDGAIVMTSQAFPTTANNRLKLIRLFTIPQSWKADSKIRAYQVGLKGPIKVQDEIPADWQDAKVSNIALKRIEAELKRAKQG